MTALYIILSIVVYFVIGGILGGMLFDDTEMFGPIFVWFLWPVFIVGIIFMILMYFPHELGQMIRRGRDR